jgi:hypothetical protein
MTAADMGSQTLYEDARNGEPNLGELFIAERIELPQDDVEIPTVLPPTLDKLLHGQDTARIEDDWLVGPPDDDDMPPPESKVAHEPKKRRKKAARISVNRREFAAISLEITGMIAISAGFWLITPWCGLICLGLCLILMGMAISRGPSSE